jgi:predicted phosphodiesterase
VRFLCLSDIHGHAHALSAVLATAERRGYGRIVVAGDICFPGPQPLLTWQRLTQLKALMVQGVGDRALATVDASALRPRDEFERDRLRRLLEVREELGSQLLRRLAKLPQIIRQPLEGGKQLAVVHGSPTDPLEPMTHDMDDATLANMLGDDPADVVLCGGSHVPFDRVVLRSAPARLPDRPVDLDAEPIATKTAVPVETRVINLGSVGEAPYPVGGSAGERAGSRFAHATFVELRDDGIEVEQFVVPLGWAA